MVEKLDFATIPLYIKIFTVIGLFFGVVGACLSFAGPAVGLNVDPKDIKDVNLKQIEELPEMVSYMDCGNLEDVLVQSLEASNPDAESYLEQNTREPSQSLKDYCNDKKAPRYFVSVFAGTFTLVGVLVFCFCCYLKRPAPEFVYVVPLVLSFVMLYDFLDFNTEVLAYVKDCTLYDTSEEHIDDKLQFIILWGQANAQVYKATEPYTRLGMMDDCNEGGHTCRRDYANIYGGSDDGCYDIGKCYSYDAEGHCEVTLDDGSTVERSEELPGCRYEYADHQILCTEFFKCNDDDDTNIDDSDTPCGAFSLKESGVEDKWKETDDVINDIGSGMIMWFCGSILNIIAMGILACTSFTVQMFVFHGISGVTKIAEGQAGAA